jgi:AraC-like DNA-binding protein
LDGRYVEEAAGTLVRYEPLTLVFHPAKLAHRDEVFAGSRMFAVELRDRWHPLLTQYGAPQRSLYTHTGAEPLWIVLRLYELLRDKASTELTVSSLLYELIGSFAGLEPADEHAPTAWLQSLRTHLDDRFTDPIDVADLANRYGVHPVHLARAFRTMYRTNVGDYVHRRRIQQACRILRQSHMTLSSIASDLGYTDQSHFSRVFRSVTGTTPGRYRAHHRT